MAEESPCINYNNRRCSVKSGFCSYNEYGIGGEHETEPKKAHPIVQSQDSPGSIKR